MRYISLFTHEPRTSQPTQDEMAAMGRLIEEGQRKGWLVVTEGVQGGTKAIRVQARAGKMHVTDAPFAEAKEVIGGYAILRANSRDEVIELTKHFLNVAGGDGTCEIHELYEMPTGSKT